MDVFFASVPHFAAHTVTFLFLSLSGFKLAVVIAVAAAAIIAAVVMLVRGRRRFSDYAAVLASAAVLFAIILLVDFKLPSDYFSDTGSPSDRVGAAVVSFDASAVAGRDGVSPENGVLLAPVSVSIGEGETVLDIALRAAKSAGLPLALDASGTYISSVGGIGERAFGAYSGWVVYINGEFPSVGANELTVKDGDVIEWRNTTGEEYE